MGSFELVIFDNDGVLVDSEPIANAILAEMITGYGLAVTTDDCIERYLGSTLERVRQLVEADLGRPLPDDFAEVYRATVYPVLAERVQPVPGAADLLDRLAATGIATCVASSAIHQRIRITLTTAGLLDRFSDDRLFSAQDVGRGKPAPDLFLHAAACLGVDPEACAVIEDAPAGVEAANAAGMTAFGYAGLTPRRLLADATGGIVDHLADVGDLLLA